MITITWRWYFFVMEGDVMSKEELEKRYLPVVRLYLIVLCVLVYKAGSWFKTGLFALG